MDVKNAARQFVRDPHSFVTNPNATTVSHLLFSIKPQGRDGAGRKIQIAENPPAICSRNSFFVGYTLIGVWSLFGACLVNLTGPLTGPSSKFRRAGRTRRISSAATPV